jgi:tRNA modification GTPase
MQRSYLDREAPIVALATPPGASALAVIRAAGPGSIALAASCFSRPEALSDAAGHSLVHGSLVDPATGEAIDEVLAAVFRAPRGPVGEDCVEISCHGSPAVVRRALSLLEAAGFAPALPGEFSFRAFLNGKLDLVEAEAVQELVRSDSEGARAEALRRLEGGLSRRLGALRGRLVGILAEAEARLDYDEEDGAPSGGLGSRIAPLRAEIEGLAASYAAGRLYEAGARVVVAGRPNAGKSSLFNLLLREERSIVASEPGTTRDWIEAGVEIEGLPLRLVDTAGLREAAGPVEAAGVERSLRLAAEAEAVIYVVDGVAGLAPEDEGFLAARPDSVRAWNKADDPRCGPEPEGFSRVCAATGEGLAGLAAAVVAAAGPAFGRPPAARKAPAKPGAPFGEGEVRVASARQKALLDRAAAALASAEAAEAAGVALDALSLDLREAADALGEITGQLASEEVLEAIFSRFCLGK